MKFRDFINNFKELRIKIEFEKSFAKFSRVTLMPTSTFWWSNEDTKKR